MGGWVGGGVKDVPLFHRSPGAESAAGETAPVVFPRLGALLDGPGVWPGTLQSCSSTCTLASL